MQINKPRGTKDLFGLELGRHNFVIAACKKFAKAYGFEEIVTPTFEHSELFKRNNENSDIVKKELYEFADRSDRSIALRPEATASLIRCLGESKMLKTKPAPIKVFSYGSMFRYERPQDGRQREFHQFDVEIVGTDSLFDVADVICYGHRVLSDLGLLDATVLKINFLGSFQTRLRWIEALQKHLGKHADELSDLSKERLRTNPLRILDDKVDGKLPCVLQAPKITQFLGAGEKAEFQATLDLLDSLDVSHEVCDNLVRGLDYYTNVVFEFVDTKSESAVIGGGQYDKLVEEITGTQMQAIGLAVGVNRCAAMLSEETVERIASGDEKKILLIGLEGVDENALFRLSQGAKAQACPLVYLPRIKDIKKAIKHCEKAGFRYLAIVGPQEARSGTAQIKDLREKKQIATGQGAISGWWAEQTPCD